MIIKRVGPVSLARISGTLYAIIGLIIGMLFSLAAALGAFASQTRTAGNLGAIFGVGAIIVFPLFYGIVGFLSSLLVAWLYNVLAGLVGGVHIDVE